MEPQDLHYIHVLIMDQDFGLMENLMPLVIRGLSQMLKLVKGDPETPNLTKSTTENYKA